MIKPDFSCNQQEIKIPILDFHSPCDISDQFSGEWPMYMQFIVTIEVHRCV